MQTFSQRADQLADVLKQMEMRAKEEQLFALGYLIPPLTLVAEYVESEEDFDACFDRLLQPVFSDDQMSRTDQKALLQLWQDARHYTIELS